MMRIQTSILVLFHRSIMIQNEINIGWLNMVKPLDANLVRNIQKHVNVLHVESIHVASVTSVVFRCVLASIEEVTIVNVSNSMYANIFVNLYG